MPGTYSDLLYHILWSTHQRRSWLVAELRPRVYQFMGGIVRDCGADLLCVGGVEDHVHILVRGRTDATIADLMRNVKARSSGWIHDTFPQLKSFAWQEGYAAFSVSASQKRRVMNYI